jgi:glutaredoxin 3
MSKVKVFTKDYCPYCDRAKALLKDKGIAYEEVRLDSSDPEGFMNLVKRSGMRTVPQIFNGDRLIGGYQELAALSAQDGLESLKG